MAITSSRFAPAENSWSRRRQTARTNRFSPGEAAWGWPPVEGGLASPISWASRTTAR